MKSTFSKNKNTEVKCTYDRDRSFWSYKWCRVDSPEGVNKRCRLSGSNIRCTGSWNRTPNKLRRSCQLRNENKKYFNERTRRRCKGKSKNSMMSPVYLFTLTDSPGCSLGACTIRVLSLQQPSYWRTLPPWGKPSCHNTIHEIFYKVLSDLSTKVWGRNPKSFYFYCRLVIALANRVSDRLF